MKKSWLPVFMPYFEDLRRNQLVTREEAFKKIGGKNDYFNRKSMHAHFTRLQNYFKPDPSVQIVNVHGKGFILES